MNLPEEHCLLSFGIANVLFDELFVATDINFPNFVLKVFLLQ